MTTTPHASKQWSRRSKVLRECPTLGRLQSGSATSTPLQPRRAAAESPVRPGFVKQTGKVPSLRTTRSSRPNG
eukprot:915482-Heterocapsa_arctica.AAC.1